MLLTKILLLFFLMKVEHELFEMQFRIRLWLSGNVYQSIGRWILHDWQSVIYETEIANPTSVIFMSCMNHFLIFDIYNVPKLSLHGIYYAFLCVMFYTIACVDGLVDISPTAILSHF